MLIFKVEKIDIEEQNLSQINLSLYNLAINYLQEVTDRMKDIKSLSCCIL